MQLAAFTADHFPLGQAAMQVNEGLPAYIVSALERRYGGLQGKTVGHPGDGLQVRVGRSAGVAQLQAAQAADLGRRDASSRRTRTSATIGSSRSTPCSAKSDILVLGAPHKAYRSLAVGGKDVVDVWGALGGGIQLYWRRSSPRAVVTAASCPGDSTSDYSTIAARSRQTLATPSSGSRSSWPWRSSRWRASAFGEHCGWRPPCSFRSPSRRTGCFGATAQPDHRLVLGHPDPGRH